MIITDLFAYACTLRFILMIGLVLPQIASAQSDNDHQQQQQQQHLACNITTGCSADSQTICVIPQTADGTDGTEGTCYPSCTLTSDTQPCPFNQACRSLPQFSTMQVGYCPDPAPCGGFIGQACSDDRNTECVDDPRDDCDPKNGGADCSGICVLLTTTTTTSPGEGEQRFCGSRGQPPCLEGETCVYKDGCDPATDCAGVCMLV